MTSDIDSRFSFHPADTRARQEAHELVRERCRDLAHLLHHHLPDGREKSLATTHLEEVMFWGNAAIARQPDEAVDHPTNGRSTAESPAAEPERETPPDLTGQLVYPDRYAYPVLVLGRSYTLVDEENGHRQRRYAAIEIKPGPQGEPPRLEMITLVQSLDVDAPLVVRHSHAA